MVSMENYIFIKAKYGDVEEVYGLIIKRIKWMDKNEISQWNKTNYLDSYPKEYFEEKVTLEQLYVMKDSFSGKVAGAVVLLEEDRRWSMDRSKSYYIHNFVSDMQIRNVGTRIIVECEKMAIKKGKDRIRFDCQASNHKLNEYYHRLGFKSVGKVQDGSYAGIKREKKLTNYIKDR